MLLQNAERVITKSTNVITKCGEYHKVGRLLQMRQNKNLSSNEPRPTLGIKSFMLAKTPNYLLVFPIETRRVLYCSIGSISFYDKIWWGSQDAQQDLELLLDVRMYNGGNGSMWISQKEAIYQWSKLFLNDKVFIWHSKDELKKDSWFIHITPRST